MVKLKMSGDWKPALSRLRHIKEHLFLAFKAQVNYDGEMVLEKMKEHIYSQDLGWTPLSPHTVELKNGDTTIYVETGELVNGMSVDRIESSDGVTIYVGAKRGQGHSGGMEMGELLIWLEYGTDKIPPRPLVQPTYEEVKELLKKAWSRKFKSILEGGD